MCTGTRQVYERLFCNFFLGRLIADAAAHAGIILQTNHSNHPQRHKHNSGSSTRRHQQLRKLEAAQLTVRQVQGEGPTCRRTESNESDRGQLVAEARTPTAAGASILPRAVACPGPVRASCTHSASTGGHLQVRMGRTRRAAIRSGVHLPPLRRSQANLARQTGLAGVWGLGTGEHHSPKAVSKSFTVPPRHTHFVWQTDPFGLPAELPRTSGWRAQFTNRPNANIVREKDQG